MPALTLTDPTMWTIAVCAGLLAGLVRGFSGFGGPVVMTLMLVHFYSPASVLAMVVVIDLAANFKLLPSTRHEVDTRLTTIVALASLCGVPLGVYALSVVDPLLMKRIIAALAAACSVFMLTGWRFAMKPSSAAQAAAGFFSGAILASTMVMLPLVVYLMMLPGSAATARANIVRLGFVMGMAVCLGYGFAGLLSWDALWRAALVGLPLLGGTVLGSKLFRATNERHVRAAVLCLLLVLSAAALFDAG